MVKQKIVVKVGMEDARKKSQAFVVAVGFEGFISAERSGDTLVVIGGEGMDAIELTRKLRKKMGFAVLCSVTMVEEKKEEKEKKEDIIAPQNFWTYQTQGMAPQPFFIEQDRDPYYTIHSCSIL